ncbi:MAG TPA: hypothetical protein VJV79_10245 [Polyangiaceae bacterium]|nr:hypothetical protein [Polyangiaceae bacterium]
MADIPAPSGTGNNTEYQINRRPDVQTITPGAQIHYVCQWKGGGRPPEVASAEYWGPRDGIRWYLYNTKEPEHFWQKQVTLGPIQNFWDRQWEEEVGRYVVIAEIRSRLDPRGTPPTYCYRPQQVGYAANILNDPLNSLVKQGKGLSPDDALKGMIAYRKLLEDIAGKHPPADQAKHKQVIDKWNDIAGRLHALIAPSAGKRRFPMRALHIENTTQIQRPLLLFLTDLGDTQVNQGRGGGMVAQKNWALVDWTDPTDPRFRGTFQGSGTTPAQAIAVCLSDWNSGNRYPEGHVSYDIPAELQGFMGSPARRQMTTDGKNTIDHWISVFEWIAIGGMLVAGFCFIFVAVPALTAGAMGASMLASTAGATLSIGQRWNDGIFDWTSDAMDGLTIVGNLVGAGVWARGARVKAFTKGGQKLDFIFIGARVGTDAAQGILLVETKFQEVDRLMHDTSFPPEERARKLLAVLAEVTALGLLTAVSFRTSAKELEALNTKPTHLPNDPRASIPEERLKALVNPNEPKPIDLTEPPIAEGHTKNGKQKTTVTTAVKPPPPKIVKPSETGLAKKYAADGHPWRDRKITERLIYLEDKDGFVFKATCNDGTLEITIITAYDPAANPQFARSFPGVTSPKRSEIMRASELYPKMYEHFEQVGNPVDRLEGLWAWDNMRPVKVKYDELIAKGMTEDAAAKEAVLYAPSYVKYHKQMGFNYVYKAKYLPEAGVSGDDLFSFTIDKD